MSATSSLIKAKGRNLQKAIVATSFLKREKRKRIGAGVEDGGTLKKTV
jgi:hypothetical protein